MLYLIGIGFKFGDINLEALKYIKKSDLIYLESYTNISPSINNKVLSKFFKKEVKYVDRELLENKTYQILNLAKKKNIAVLFIGDPLFATTHISLLKEAKSYGIKTKVVHNISIINLISKTGLFPYKFGKIGSIPLIRENFNPTSFIKVLEDNYKINAHTLYLLEVDKNNFVTPNEAFKRILSLTKFVNKESLAIVLCRGNTKYESIVSGKIKDLINYSFGNPPCSIVIPSNLNPIEEENMKVLTKFIS